MNQTFYTCRHCGNIIAMIRDNGVPVYCCGEKMPRLIPGATEGAREKHAPVFHVDGNTVHVTVGFLEHPMTPEHHIQWICLETARGIQYVHLNPGDPPKASFPLSQGIGWKTCTPSATNTTFGRNNKPFPCFFRKQGISYENFKEPSLAYGKHPG